MLYAKDNLSKNILQLRKHLVTNKINLPYLCHTIPQIQPKTMRKGVSDKWCSTQSNACGVVVLGRLRCIVLRKCHWLITKLSLEPNQPIWFTDHFLLKETNPPPQTHPKIYCHKHLTELLKDWFQPLLLKVRLPTTPRTS